MSSSMTAEALLDLVRKSQLLSEKALSHHFGRSVPTDPKEVVESLVQAGLLTRFQANLLLQGKHKGFVVGGYKVMQPLGKGDRGVVYLAEHTTLRRQVALKFVLSSLLREKGALERFHREGRAAASLSHPNIVRVYDIGREGDSHFLVMEYVDGRDLEDVLQERGKLPVAEAAGYCRQAALGLQHAHERGLVHRDVKPANLLVDRDGTVKVLDLGLARFVEDSADNLTEMLGNGAILGSPDYSAPELIDQKAEPRSDIYSLGAVLYTLITGQPPFPAMTMEKAILGHKSNEAVPLLRREPTAPQKLAEAVHRMLAKNPADRFLTMAETAEAIRPWAAEPPSSPARAKPMTQPKSSGRLATALAWVRSLWSRR